MKSEKARSLSSLHRLIQKLLQVEEQSFLIPCFGVLKMNMDICNAALFFKKVVLRNFTKFALLKMKLRRYCFPVNFVKYIRTPFLLETSRWQLLYLIQILKKCTTEQQKNFTSEYILPRTKYYKIHKIEQHLKLIINTPEKHLKLFNVEKSQYGVYIYLFLNELYCYISVFSKSSFLSVFDIHIHIHIYISLKQ